MKILLVTVVLAFVAGCRTIATNAISSNPTPVVRVGTRACTWEVRGAGERLGLVVLFQERGLARDSLYVVRNPWHQDLGLIDGLGRAYRYLPHLEEPVWVGSGTIAVGAQRILGVSECELIELTDPILGPVPGSPQEAGASAASESASQPSSAPPPDGGLPQYR